MHHTPQVWFFLRDFPLEISSFHIRFVPIDDPHMQKNRQFIG